VTKKFLDSFFNFYDKHENLLVSTYLILVTVGLVYALLAMIFAPELIYTKKFIEHLESGGAW